MLFHALRNTIFNHFRRAGVHRIGGGGSEALCTPSFTGRGGTRPAGRVSPPAGPRSPRPVGELRTQTRRAPRTQRAPRLWGFSRAGSGGSEVTQRDREVRAPSNGGPLRTLPWSRGHPDVPVPCPMTKKGTAAGVLPGGHWPRTPITHPACDAGRRGAARRPPLPRVRAAPCAPAPGHPTRLGTRTSACMRAKHVHALSTDFYVQLNEFFSLGLDCVLKTRA